MKLEPFRAADSRADTRRKMQLANDAAEAMAQAIVTGQTDVAALWRAAFEAAGIAVSDNGLWTAEVE